MRRVHRFWPFLLCAACVAAPGAEAPITRASGTPLAVDPLMEVRNDHWLPVQVYVLWSGTRYFLGEVPPARTGHFRIPRSLVGDAEVRFLADPLGSTAEVLTDPVDLRGGRHLEWRLRKNLDSSRVRVM